MGLFGFSGSRPAASLSARLSGGQSATLWPRDRVEAAILKRYGSVEGPHLRDEYVLYGVIEGQVAFVIVLHHPDGRAKDIDQLIFYTRFEGVPIDEGTAAAINRNLHIAAAQARDGVLEIFAGVEPSGPYDDRALAGYFDSWKRDLAVAVGVLTGGAQFGAEFGLDRDANVAKFATNRIGEDGRAARELFRSFFGGAVERRVCGACSGRGRIGFIARRCEDCDGAGFTERKRQNV